MTQQNQGRFASLLGSDSHNCTSRRQFLALAGAAGAAACLPGESMAAERRPKVIDIHHHFYAPAYQKGWLDWEDQRKIPHFATQVAWTPADYEFQRLHYDTANATSPTSMGALLKLAPASQVLFGTDYPYVGTDFQLANLRKLGLSAPQLRAITSANALKLLPHLSS